MAGTVTHVPRILVLNHPNLTKMYEEVAAGSVPDQYLWGINHFEQNGYSVEIIPCGRSQVLQRISSMLRRSPIPLGDLDQEVTALRSLRRADLIYSPFQHVGQSLGYLRWAGAVNRPIVWIVHSPLDEGRLRRPRRPVMRALLRGLDAYPALSTAVADDLAEIAGSSERTGAVRWGPDPNWYPQAEGAGSGVVAAGATKRDFETFSRAVKQTRVKSRVVSGGLSYRELVDVLVQARAVAIPLRVQWPWTVNGLQVLLDALAMGKPVIITRNPWIDIDVEALGIGIWVEPGDVDGWRDAIIYLDERPDVAVEMGRRARALVDSGERSSVTFANQMMSVFEHVLSR